MEFRIIIKLVKSKYFWLKYIFKKIKTHPLKKYVITYLHHHGSNGLSLYLNHAVQTTT